MSAKTLLLLFVFCGTLFSMGNALTLNHEYYNYTIFDYINGRKMYLSKCYLQLAPDLKDIFTWHPNNLTFAGPCGTGSCAFTLSKLNFTLGACQGNYSTPCTTYTSILKSATRISLISNLINFYNGTNPSPIFVLENIA